MTGRKKVTQITIQPEHHFSELLRVALAKNGLSGRSFSIKLKISQGYVSNIITGRIPPPKRDLVQWAEVLKLDGEFREKFFIEGLIAHCPEKIANEYRMMAMLCGRFIKDNEAIGGYRLNAVENFMGVGNKSNFDEDGDEGIRDLEPDDDMGLGEDERKAARVQADDLK